MSISLTTINQISITRLLVISLVSDLPIHDSYSHPKFNSMLVISPLNSQISIGGFGCF